MPWSASVVTTFLVQHWALPSKAETAGPLASFFLFHRVKLALSLLPFAECFVSLRSNVLSQALSTTATTIARKER